MGAGFGNAKGVFGEFPGTTPKYALNNQPGGRTDDFRNTMARMFIQMTDDQLRSFLTGLQRAKADSTTLMLAKTLAGTGRAGTGYGYIDFLLQGVSMQLTEKMEVVEFVGDDWTTYYYGQAAPIFNFSGCLLNTLQDDQANAMFRLYRDMLRGSALARIGNALRIRYSGFLATGYVSSMAMTLTADNENALQFNFPMVVKEFTLQNNAIFKPAPLNTSFQGSDLAAAPNVSGTAQVRLGMVPPKGSAADLGTPASFRLNILGPLAPTPAEESQALVDRITYVTADGS